METNKADLVRLILIPLIVNLMLAGASAQQSPIAAITQDGRKVLLYPDGTWKLAEQAQPQASPTVGNDKSRRNDEALGIENLRRVLFCRSIEFAGRVDGRYTAILQQ